MNLVIFLGFLVLKYIEGNKEIVKYREYEMRVFIKEGWDLVFVYWFGFLGSFVFCCILERCGY